MPTCAQTHRLCLSQKPKLLDPQNLGITFNPTPTKNSPPKPLTCVTAVPAPYLAAPDPRLPLATYVMPLEAMRRF